MNPEDAEALIRSKLAEVAPEIAGEPIEPDETFRDQFEIDSMDFLNFITALHEATGLDIPEADYTQLSTLKGASAYLLKHVKEG